DIVSRHPCTARFVSTKLIHAFVTDKPSEQYVDRISNVFLDTDGDIQQVLWAMFQSPEFRDPANFGGKVKTPLEQSVSAIRAVGGNLRPRPWGGYEWPWLWYYVYDQGQYLFRFPIPTGYPELGDPWISANGFLNRWKYADDLMMLYPTDTTYQIYTDPMAEVRRLGLTTADGVLAQRRIPGILSLARKHGPAITEDAARFALEAGAPAYRFLRRYLERVTVPAAALTQFDPLIRPLTL
ncbi:DUF1800 family protein, partial [Gemmatimonas sp.]|uniref:DUF1800 family protein n=1 Tax=Gemmatimonas sp. TaxID=1962908 RepID=UPI00286E38CA